MSQALNVLPLPAADLDDAPREPTAPEASAPVQAAATEPASDRFWRTGFLAAAAWAIEGLLVRFWPNQVAGFTDWAFTDEFGLANVAVGGVILALALSYGGLARLPQLREGLRLSGRWLVALPVLLLVWQVLTAKLTLLPGPFFAPPQSLVEVFAEDWSRLGLSVAHSARLLLNGLLLGALVGFITGVAIGWSREVNYWVHPVLRFLGPVPSSALLPIAFFLAPSSYAAAVFLVALATFFPVAVLTWSGVASVNKSYYDVARTLGASNWFLVWRVAIPAALPQVFVGLFMGLGASFTVLVTAEMMGVKAGLGWYLQWAQGWAAYSNMFAALLVMAVLCSGLITLLFTLRDRVLSWQKGTVKW